jgi:hypothetical protein
LLKNVPNVEECDATKVEKSDEVETTKILK